MTHASFSADWLRQREPFDAAARAMAAVRLGLPVWLATQHATPLRVIDLACGTGANFRVLAPQLGAGQQWLVVDHDAALLAQWPQALGDWAGRHGHHLESTPTRLQVRGPGFDAAIERQRLDLAADLETLPLAAASLVTASALLDLVSAAWLQRLVDACGPARAALLFTLNVEGLPQWQPADPQDALATAQFRAHQTRDKGFGPALGPAAGATLARLSRDAGYAVRRARSDWLLRPADGRSAADLQRALIDGIAAAAIEQAPTAIDAMQAWQVRRQALTERAALRIGHVDVWATTADRGARRSRSHSMSSPIA